MAATTALRWLSTPPVTMATISSDLSLCYEGYEMVDCGMNGHQKWRTKIYRNLCGFTVLDMNVFLLMRGGIM